MPVRKIRFRRGNQTNLPNLDAGEPGFALDTRRLYVGGSTGNVEIATKEYVDAQIESVEQPEGLATEEYVDEAIAGIEAGGSTTLTHLELTNQGPLIVLEPELGEPVTFVKSEETPADEIDEGLTLTRGSIGALYNSEQEEEYDRDSHTSPLGTLWNSDGFGDLSNIRQRDYVTFREALGGQVGNNVIGAELIMLDTANNKYYKFEFSDWGQNNGGSFAYTRTELTDLNFFSKSDYGSEVDEISEGLHITRGNNQSLFNPLEEDGWDEDVSPVNSLWNFDGWDDFSDIETREYQNLAEAFDDAFDDGFAAIPGKRAVMKDTTTGKYWAIHFLTWTQNNNGGGFSYLRYELDATKLKEGVKFADGSILKSALGVGRVKSTASSNRRIEEVVGSKTVSVTERVTDDYQSTSTRTTTSNYEIFVSRTEGDTLDLVLSEYWDDDADFEFEISFDNSTFRPAYLSSIQTTEYWFYYDNTDGYVPQTQGDTVYIRVISGGDPVVWWDKNDLPSGGSNFRGAIIDYHAFTGEATIIGTIHIVDDDGDENITHTEVSSGSTDSENDDLWLVDNEGTISYRRIDGEQKTLKVHWTAKVFYGSEYYD
jgi:hypothetical protein